MKTSSQTNFRVLGPCSAWWRFVCAVIVFLSCMAATIARAQTPTWTAIGPDGGTVQSLAIDPVDPNTLYAGSCGGGIFRTTNAGARWQAINQGLTNAQMYQCVAAIAVDPWNHSTVYSAGSGVFKSTDGGDSWVPMLTNMPVTSMAMDPQIPNTLYAGTWHNGVFKSTDGGSTWNAINNGLYIFTSITHMVVDPLTPNILYVGTGDGNFGAVYKSVDGGDSWNRIGRHFASIIALALAPSDPAILYTFEGGPFGGPAMAKTTDAGATWTYLNVLGPYTWPRALAIDPIDSNTVYAGLTNSVLKTIDGGNTWRDAGLTSIYIDVLAIDPQKPAILYSGTYFDGVFKTTDGATNWSASTTGLAANESVTALAVDPKTPATIYAGIYGGPIGPNRTSNGGASWKRLYGYYSYRVDGFAIDPTTPTTIYAAANGGVLKSTNQGEIWSSPSLPSSVKSLAIDPSSTTTLYAGIGTYSSDNVFKSTDGSGTWGAAGLPNKWVNSFAIDPTATKTIYAGTLSGVFKTTDGAAAWTEVNVGLTGDTRRLSVGSLAIDPSTPTALYAGTAAGVFKSINSAGSWSAASTGIPDTAVNALAINPVTPSTLYAGTDQGVFKSTDGAASWTDISAGLSNKVVLTLAIDPLTPSTIYAGTDGNGIFVLRTTPRSMTFSWALGIEPPFPCVGGYWLGNDGTIPDAPPPDERWVGAGCTVRYFDDEYHIGFDMKLPGPPQDTENHEVFAISPGKVVSRNESTSWGTGNVALLIEHTLDDGSKFLALYGHIRTTLHETSADGKVVHVSADEPIGLVGPYPPTPHLHFGIHKKPVLPADSHHWGAMPKGSWPNTNGFTDPLEWITAFQAKCENATAQRYRPNGATPVHPNGGLIKVADTPTVRNLDVYVLQNGQKRKISSEGRLQQLYGPGRGFGFTDVVIVDDVELAAYPEGPPVIDPIPFTGSGRCEPPGRLIQQRGAGEVSMVTGDCVRRVFTKTAFLKLGYSWCMVTEVDNYYSTDYALGPDITQ